MRRLQPVSVRSTDDIPFLHYPTVGTLTIIKMQSDSSSVQWLNRLSNTIQKSWLRLVVGFLLIYSLLPFVAPLLMRYGYANAAQFIYKPYQLVCHTYAFRSFFLFGEQPVYARAEGTGDFERLSGIDVNTGAGLLAARDFVGNARMGFKVALCERDVAIYLSMAINGMVYGLVGRRARGLAWPLFIVIGLLPIGLDGFSQLFSQPPFSSLFPFSLIGFRESTWWLRLLTGSLFGTSVAWLVFPLIGSTLNTDQSEQPRVNSNPSA